MTRQCELTGKLPMSGQIRSHAENKTKRTFRPNLVNVTLISDALQRKVRLRISAHALKTVERRGGLDAFLVKAKDEELSQRCQKLKREVRRCKASRRRPDCLLAPVLSKRRVARASLTRARSSAPRSMQGELQEHGALQEVVEVVVGDQRQHGLAARARGARPGPPCCRSRSSESASKQRAPGDARAGAISPAAIWRRRILTPSVQRK